eukprot:6574542-Pyramimonas_sp.AAC.1
MQGHRWEGSRSLLCGCAVAPLVARGALHARVHLDGPPSYLSIAATDRSRQPGMPHVSLHGPHLRGQCVQMVIEAGRSEALRKADSVSDGRRVQGSI